MSRTASHEGRRRAKFFPEEDELLKDLVQKHGSSNWHLIASLMPGRNTRQVRERYLNYLKPDLKLDEWTEEEEKLLLEKYDEYGNHWKQISMYFPNRTDIAVKSKYHKMERKRLKQQKKQMMKMCNKNKTKTEKKQPKKEQPKKEIKAVVPKVVEVEKKALEEATFDYLKSESFLNEINFFFDENQNPFCSTEFDWF